MSKTTLPFLAALLTPLLPGSAAGQDLYDPATLRTIDLAFHATNWWTLLQQNYQSQTNILADLSMEGVTYPDVGVRIRGNTSYTTLPAGSQKVSLNVELDFTHVGQDLLGYDSLNLNNAHRDPTFCREVAYNNFVARYIPNGRANHVVLTINGENWGVYVNVQQFDKDMLRSYFADENGMRVKCANSPNGPGLRYNGTSPTGYTGYEIKDDGGLLDPWAAHIAVCAAVTNTPLGTWQQADAVVAIDPSIWSVVLENLFSDDDSYSNKGADFVTYRDPVDGRTHILQTDGNESWTNATWAPDRSFTATNKPFLSHLLDVPELRQRYMAHMRTALEEFDWAQLGAVFDAHRALIDAEVQADPKKLYPYQSFLSNFTATVSLGGGFGGGNVIGLQPFVVQRETLLESHPELSAPAPVIPWILATPESPGPGETVTITALVEGPGAAVGLVELFYLPAPGSYERVTMLDDGLSGDGLAGDGVYGAQLPVAGTAGQTVRYYVAARSATATAAMTFHPRLTELQPASIDYTFGLAGIRITEYMYSGADGEYVELTNTSSAPIDLTGWSFDDQSATAGAFDLSAAGVLAPGESILVTDVDPLVFAAAWGVPGTVLGPNVDSPLGRNDEINVYDALGQLVERLTFGDEAFPGSVRAKDASAQPCAEALGADDPYGWNLAVVGDPWGSYLSSGGDIGSPGIHASVTCGGLGSTYCTSNANSTGGASVLSASGSAAVAANDLTFDVLGLPTHQFGYMLMSDVQGFTANFGGSQGNLCLGGSIIRFAGDVLDSGASGTVQFSPDLSNLPQGTLILPGAQWNFQYWHRDGAGASNTSNGLEIDFR